MMDYGKTKKKTTTKKTDKSQRFDWMKLIHGYRLVSTGWLADASEFDSMI